MNVPIESLYRAYRKAKREAFGDTNCAHGLKFLSYEQDLPLNLARLRRLLRRQSPTWSSDPQFLGAATCIPKSVSPHDQAESSGTIHFQSSDPQEQWKRQCGGRRATADFRPVIDASVDYMVVAALWILEIGHLYDAKLDTRYAVGNRLKRWRPEEDQPTGTPGALNTESPELFQPYFSAYGKWQSAGLRAMRGDLEKGHRIVAVTMDLRRFYHQVDAQFLLRDSYLARIGITLTLEHRSFTRCLIESFDTWNREAQRRFRCEPRGLPVGLTASSLVANILLHELDQLIATELVPTYYARYVDDLFLVIRCEQRFEDGEAFLNWLGERLSPLVTTVTESAAGENLGTALRVDLPYGDGSELLFVGKKQKIFQLQGEHGIDLIRPIEEQIRRQSSEYRDLPKLPASESQMAHRALLVTPNATLNADALRKADAVTIRRSGFALLLQDVEAHVRDLDPSSWVTLRAEFYGLAERHLLTPTAFFDYYRYFPRVIGIMSACGDWDQIESFLRGLRRLKTTLGRTCRSDDRRLRVCLRTTFENLGRRVVEAVLQSVNRGDRRMQRIFRLLIEVTGTTPPRSVALITRNCHGLVLLDWSKRPYATRWVDLSEDEPSSPRPRSAAVVRSLPFSAISTFRAAAGLPRPHWPAIAFPTRPIAFREITSRAPSLIEDGAELSAVVRGLRGSWMPSDTALIYTPEGPNGNSEIQVPNVTNRRPKIAVTSLEVLNREWEAAASGQPVITLERYQRYNALLNSIVSGRHRPDYVLLPELAIPRRWAMSMVWKMVSRGVSVLGGLEYRGDNSNPRFVHNEALIALRTNFAGYPGAIFLLQPKLAPAWPERELLTNHYGKSLAPPSPLSLRHPVYRHQGLCFGLLICSELTDIQNRERFQGKVDALFVPEWNRDIESFGALIESAALDVHAFIIQANNRRYGDSRIRAPMKDNFRRDVVRVKGGLNDYFVVGEINYMSLRRFQSHAVPPTGDAAVFKPFPIGFPDRLAPNRRAALR